MKAKLIYRVEHIDSEFGPYQSKGEVFDILDENDFSWDITDRHPAPSFDSKLTTELQKDWEDIWAAIKSCKYGFSSIDQLKRWFYNDDELKMLDGAGFQLVVLASTNYWVGDTQVLYDPDNSHSKLRYIPLLDFVQRA